MDAADFQAFSGMLSLTAQQYNKQLSPELVRFYFEGLVHLPFDSVRAALNAHIRNADVGQFMPKVADIIRACEGKTEDAAYAALVELQAAFAYPGTYASVAFEDKITMAVVRDMGGWPALGARDADDWAQFGAKDFMKRYRIYKERGVVNAPDYLPGIFEQSPHGTQEKLVRIGCEKKLLSQ